jgi:hypothetical protein
VTTDPIEAAAVVLKIFSLSRIRPAIFPPLNFPIRCSQLQAFTGRTGAVVACPPVVGVPRVKVSNGLTPGVAPPIQGRKKQVQMFGRRPDIQHGIWGKD